MKHTERMNAPAILRALLPVALLWLCVLLLAACHTAGEDTPPDGLLTLAPGGAVTDPSGGLVTLPAGEETTPAEDETYPAPGAAALREDVDYDALVITALYATGNRPGAMADASFVEIYNNSDTDIPLAGVSLYLSDRGGDFVEYPFAAEDVIPARGHFLVRGRDAVGESEDVLSVDTYDRRFATLAPTSQARLALAAAERTLPTDTPMAELDGLFAYITAHPTDTADTYHYIKNPSSDDLVRRKSDTDKADLQTIDLPNTGSATLALIAPESTKGKNSAVRSLMAEVTFSHPSGIYAEGFDLSLSAPAGYTVYYTINDTDPRDARPLTYTTPLHLKDTTEMAWGRLTAESSKLMGSTYAPLTATFPGAIVIKAYARRASDGATTPLTSRTYFIGEDFAAWDVDLISLTVDSDLFLGSTGIYNNIIQGEGTTRERIPAHVELITSAGEVAHTGWCEIAMNGKGSLGMTQKSFRIMLRSSVMDTDDVGENLSTMGYDLFGDYATTHPDGESVTTFRHILLRNGGGDMSGSTISRSHIGDAYIQRLDRYLTPDVMAYAPTMVFINGEFWGMYNARERLDEKYFSIKYSIPEEDVSVVECPYPLFYGWNVDYTEGLTDPDEIAEAQYFMDLVRYCQNNDMANPTHYQYIANAVDIDGLIDFYCAQIYLNCSDWPSNNIKIWRNTNPDHPTMDTRWHFCIVDTDHGVGLNSSVETNLWGVISDGPVLSRMVNHLLANPTFRERFLMRYIWCMEVYFAPERMTAELDDLVTPILPIMQYQLDRWRCTDGTRTDWDKWYSYIEVIRNYAENRPAPAKAQFLQWAGINEATYQQLKTKAIQEWGSTVE